MKNKNKDFIYLNSNKSGIGDRLTDLILISTYSLYLGCKKIFLHWVEDNEDMVGRAGIHSNIRRTKTPFRSQDYLLTNLLNYLILPENIYFVSQKELRRKCKDYNNVFVFSEYTGMRYTLYSFMEKIKLSENDKIEFEKTYFENFKKIKFKNIPENIVDYFQKNDVITVHLRRGDKVVNDNGISNNIEEKELINLNNITINSINKLIELNYKYFHFVSDEKKARDFYINLFKDNKVECNFFNGDNVSQTYYDLYSLVHSEKIILSQVFSVFSIFSTLVSRNELYFLLKHPKMNSFLDYKNINSFHNNIYINTKIFKKELLIHKFNTKKYPFANLVKKCYKDYFKTDVNLEELHFLLDSDLINKEDKKYFGKVPIFGKTDRKSIFNSIFYKYYDNNNEFNDLYISFIKNFIKPIFFPSEKYLVIQKTPNIRQHLPLTTTIGRLSTDPNPNLIGIHEDGNFGHNKEEFNFILPVTRMFGTNSIYFEPFPNSEIPYSEYLNVCQNLDELGCYYFNKCKHYNKINVTNKTRVSFDFRIIPYSRYFETQHLSKTTKQKLIIGDYFMLLDVR
jgi:hypothetical protein